MKKIFTLLFLLVLVLGLSACKKDNASKKDVESVEFTFQQTVLTPGEYKLTARVLPAEANQSIKFQLMGIVEGVTVQQDGTLKILSTAADQQTFKVWAISNYDVTKKVLKEFKVSNPPAEDFIDITTEAQLREIGKTEESLTKNYRLKNDIVLTAPWDPIGVADHEEDDGTVTLGKYFNGIFDGKGFKISNIEINAEYNAGFFAQIGENGQVLNTEFEGVVNAQGWSGGIAGINLGLIQNVIANIKVTVQKQSAGAVVGVNRGIIKYAYAKAKTVSEQYGYTEPRSAGLVAANEGTLTEVYGDVKELKTDNYVAFNNLKNDKYMLETPYMKKASTWAEFDTDVWFIADGTYPLLKHEGFTDPTIVIEKYVVIKNKPLNVEINNDNNTLQVETEVVFGAETDKVKYELTQAVNGVTIDANTGLVTFDLNVIELNFEITVKATLVGDDNVNDVKTFKIKYNKPVVEDTVHITTEDELFNYLAGQENPEMLAKTYILDNNITLTKPWTQIGKPSNEDTGTPAVPFTGVFDGNGFTISGIDMPDIGYTKGFFGCIGNGAVVKNTKFVGKVYATAWSAFLVAENFGTVTECLIDAEVKGTSGKLAFLAVHNKETGIFKNVVVKGTIASEDNSNTIGLLVTNAGNLENVFANATTIGTNNLLANPATPDDGTHIITHEQFINENTYVAFDKNIWNITNGEEPKFKKE